MKTLTYSIVINKPVDEVFAKIMDKSVYADWAKPWGPGMTYEGAWEAGQHISFFDTEGRGTKVIVEEVNPNESIKMKHVAMVGPGNVEVEELDETMQKWIGSREDYFFIADGDNQTTLEVIIQTDKSFEEMMSVWPQALQYFKELCEAQ